MIGLKIAENVMGVLLVGPTDDSQYDIAGFDALEDGDGFCMRQTDQRLVVDR